MSTCRVRKMDGADTDDFGDPPFRIPSLLQSALSFSQRKKELFHVPPVDYRYCRCIITSLIGSLESSIEFYLFHNKCHSLYKNIAERDSHHQMRSRKPINA